MTDIISLEQVKEYETLLEKMDKKGIILLIGGVTASGKTTVSQYLESTLQKHFNKMKQVTTRRRRIGEDMDAYDFLDDNRYDRLIREGQLFATTTIGENRYGTYKENDNGDKIGVVVVNNQGLLDSKKMENTHRVIRIGIYCDAATIKRRLSDQYDPNDPSSVERFNRDIDAEYEVYSNCHYIIDNNGTFKDTLESTLNSILNHKF